MIASLLVGMLCVYLLTFAVMFMLISQRLRSEKMGMDAFAAGNLMLGGAYVLQLLEGPGWSTMGVANHTLTLSAVLAYWVGGARFFGRPVPLLQPLLALAVGYSLMQLLVHWMGGSVARYSMLAAICALTFATMVGVLVYGMRSFARDLRGEMLLFAGLISGICVLNLIKLGKLLGGGLEALDMDENFQKVFYIYMCSLATILPPAIVWLVLRRLTDALRTMAARDPLTQLLNRRGLRTALQGCFRKPGTTARLLLVDIDHFKRINDTHGHHVGDAVLCGVAEALRAAVRKDDLICRLGGEEFVAICVGADSASALREAERIRSSVEQKQMAQELQRGNLRCTVTIGVSHCFEGEAALEQAMQQADAGLYRGKSGGRNRVVMACEGGCDSAEVAPAEPRPSVARHYTLGL